MIEYSPVALLESGHDRSQFDCGIEPLNIYLRQYALQNQKKGIVRNYVTCRGSRVVAYYSLASRSHAFVLPARSAAVNNPPRADNCIGQVVLQLAGG